MTPPPTARAPASGDLRGLRPRPQASSAPPPRVEIQRSRVPTFLSIADLLPSMGWRDRNRCANRCRGGPALLCSPGTMEELEERAMTEDLRYPVGRLQLEGPLGEERRLELIEQIAETPERLRAAVRGLDPKQLDTPYRPGGWTVRQVLHHVPDSHLNASVLFKLALAE